MAEINDKIILRDDLYNKVKLLPSPRPEPNIGIDLDNSLYDDITVGMENSAIDISKINAFTSISLQRDLLYAQLDAMALDPIIESALEIYAEDATERNELNQIVWVESSDSNITNYISYLLDSFRINKNIYKWAYSLCKYGDLYIRLYRKSDLEDKNDIFNTRKQLPLNEDIKLHLYKNNDEYVDYVEMVDNPAEMFELTKFGKTQGYIKAPVQTPVLNEYANGVLTNSALTYQYRQNDVSIYLPTEFVHAAISNTTNRYPEQVEIFINDDKDEESKAVYSVRKGTSLLQDLFRVWRQLKLLENSILLNRITKSAIVRLINVNVGDMPKEKIGPYLAKIKLMIEQKSAINESVSMSEYNSPGPVENNVYIPVHGEIGSINVALVGGEGADPKSLMDLDYFKTRLYSGLGIPKQYLGDTDDSTGFNGGTSLSLISSRYAKKIRAVESSLIEAITDIINLILINRGMQSYINKFEIKMQPPTTQEEKDRKDNVSTSIGITNDIMNLLGDIEDPITKLKMTKTLLSSNLVNPELINLLDETIAKMEEQGTEENSEMSLDASGDEEDLAGLGGFSGGGDYSGDLNSDIAPEEESTEGEEGLMDISEEEPSEESQELLPSMKDLGKDFTDNTEEF